LQAVLTSVYLLLTSKSPRKAFKRISNSHRYASRYQTWAEVTVEI
jgi:hypothetical protein